MKAISFLLDTNIVIGLEDNHVVREDLARLLRQCNEHGIKVFVHEASVEDISRDKDKERRKITASKLRKFDRIGRSKLPKKETLVRNLGAVGSHNDEIDVEILWSLKKELVDFFITEDQRLIKRAYRHDLGRRTFNINEAEAWINRTFDEQAVFLSNISDKKVYQLDIEDEFFRSLKQDYPGFEKWFEKCAQEHRPCWSIEGPALRALLIYKKEKPGDANIRASAKKILKIATLKVRDQDRGEKFGEQLLKQCLWYAQKNKFDLTYLTVFSKHEALIRLIERFGFRHTHSQENGELVYEKKMLAGKNISKSNDEPLSFQREYYPKFLDNSRVRKFCVPIWPKWHKRLFPELSGADSKTLGLTAAATQGSQRPGNTIRKVYLCRAKAGAVRPGDLLLFYVTKGDNFALSQSITTVGVVERIRETDNYGELIRLTGKRSVFTEQNLRDMLQERSSPIKVIDFLLSGHLETPLELDQAIELGVLRSWPQTIGQITEPGYKAFKSRSRLVWGDIE